MEKTVKEQVVGVIAEQLTRPAEELSLDATFEAVGADSLDRVEIVMKVEELFDVELNDDTLETLPTIGAFAEYVSGVVASSNRAE